MTDLIGWFAAAVLALTIGRQVYTQWRDRASAGISRWLFIGQMTASVAFTAYSWLLGNWVFVASNLLMLVTAGLGQWIYLSNRDRGRGASKRRLDGRRDARHPASATRRARPRQTV